MKSREGAARAALVGEVVFLLAASVYLVWSFFDPDIQTVTIFALAACSLICWVAGMVVDIRDAMLAVMRADATDRAETRD